MQTPLDSRQTDGGQATVLQPRGAPPNGASGKPFLPEKFARGGPYFLGIEDGYFHALRHLADSQMTRVNNS